MLGWCKPQIYQHHHLACYYLSHARFEHFLEMNVLLCVRLIYQLAVEKDNAMTLLTRDQGDHKRRMTLSSDEAEVMLH